MPRGAPEIREHLLSAMHSACAVLLRPTSSAPTKPIPKFLPVAKVCAKIHTIWTNENTWIFSSHRSVSGTVHGTIRDSFTHSTIGVVPRVTICSRMHLATFLYSAQISNQPHVTHQAIHERKQRKKKNRGILLPEKTYFNYR